MPWQECNLLTISSIFFNKSLGWVIQEALSCPNCLLTWANNEYPLPISQFRLPQVNGMQMKHEKNSKHASSVLFPLRVNFKSVFPVFFLLSDFFSQCNLSLITPDVTAPI